ncbi:TPA: AAA family ATPase [Vibrio parahaemolyticus]|nr:AAA family ATPase [Vibrio parahaemolyticus]
MINYLITDSFKKLGSKEFRFEAGSNVLCGENGAGKSTVFKAIRFALYGVNASGSQRDTLPTYGQKNCRVVLGLHDLRIERDLKNCTIYKGDQIVAEGNTASTAYIEDYLGMDFKAFNIFCLSPQGETQALLSIGATEINRRVEQYSGVTLIDNVISKAVQDIKILNVQIEGVDKVDLAPLCNSVLELNVNVDALAAECKVLSQRKTDHKQALATARETLQDARIDNEKIHQAQTAVKDAREALSELDEELKANKNRLNELKKKDTGFSDLQEKLEAKQAALHCKVEANGQRERLEREFNQASAQVNELTELADTEFTAITNVKALENAIEHLEQESTKANEKVFNKRTELENVKQQIDSGVCPTCKRPHEDYDEDKANALYLRLHSEEAALSASANMIQGQLLTKRRELRSESAHVNGYREKLSDARDKLSQIQLALATANHYPKDEIDKGHEEILSLRTELELIKAQRQELRDCEDRDILIHRKIDAQNAKLTQYRANANRFFHDIGELEKAVEHCQKIYDSVEESLASKERDHINLKNDLEYAEINLANAEKENKEYDRLAKELGTRTDLLKLMRDKRQGFMSEIWLNILARATVFVSETTDGWISEILRDDKGNFSFREEGKHAVPIIGNASGAQAAFCGAALRIGISQALYGKHSLLMLDEPTESMTENNAARLAAGLLNLGGQVLLITHRKSEAFTAQNVIEIS